MEAAKFFHRSLLLLGGFAALLLLLPFQGCQKQDLDKEATHGLAKDPYPVAPRNLAPTLKILIWPDTITKEIKDSFEAKYAVKLEIDTIANDDDAYNKLKASPNKWDLVMVTQYMADRMRQEKMLQEVPRHNPYIYQYIDTSVLNQKADPHMKYFVPFDYSALGISFNIDYMAGFPRKWAYLELHRNNPFLYGRIVMTDDMRYAMAAAMLYAGLDPSNPSPQNIQTARDLLIVNVKELGLRFLPDVQIREEMKRGDALMAITWSGEAAAILKNKASCRFLIPEGTSIMAVDGFSIPKNAPSPDTAALFIEFILHPYNSLLSANYSMYASVNQRTMKYVDRFVINGPSCTIAAPAQRTHMKYLNEEEQKLFLDAWAEVKKAQIDPAKINLIPLK